MIAQSDLRWREAKKKIFYEQINRLKAEEKNGKDDHLKVAQSEISRNDNRVQQLNKQIGELQSNNIELRKLLRQERERYDKLFEQYEQLAQKNSVIEKQYINLKYQHNKEIKELKKAIANIIKEKVGKAHQQFLISLKQEKIVESLKNKIDRFLQKINELCLIPEKYRMKRSSRKETQIIESVEDKPKDSLLTVRSFNQEKKIEFFELEEANPIPKLSNSPQKQKQLRSVKSQSNISCKEMIVFQDEYYGTIEEFPQYEQKIMQRRNFQLMKRNSRASNQVKRKKIFQQL